MCAGCPRYNSSNIDEASGTIKRQFEENAIIPILLIQYSDYRAGLQRGNDSVQKSGKRLDK